MKIDNLLLYSKFDELWWCNQVEKIDHHWLWHFGMDFAWVIALTIFLFWIFLITIFGKIVSERKQKNQLFRIDSYITVLWWNCSCQISEKKTEFFLNTEDYWAQFSFLLPNTTPWLSFVSKFRKRRNKKNNSEREYFTNMIWCHIGREVKKKKCPSKKIKK